MENKKSFIPREVKADLERLMDKKGYIPEEYVTNEINTISTIGCPLCGELLNVRCLGNSVDITCPSHGSIAGGRGI